MKKTIKTKKSTFKPAYTVDITNCQDCNDVLLAFAHAKQEAGQALTNDELNAIIDENAIIVIIKYTEKKLPWYKRFWNWLTRKNK